MKQKQIYYSIDLCTSTCVYECVFTGGMSACCLGVLNEFILYGREVVWDLCAVRLCVWMNKVA